MGYTWQFTGPVDKLPPPARVRAWYNRRSIELKRHSHVALPYASTMHRSRSREIAVPSGNGWE